MPINIEITTSPDVTLLASLHGASFDEGWDADAVRDLMAAKNTFALVAEGGKGFALVRDLTDGTAEILTLAVDPTARKQGVARELVASMQQWAQSRGIRSVFLEVRKSNAAAQALYGNAGFAAISTRKEYYRRGDGTREDATVLQWKNAVLD